MPMRTASVRVRHMAPASLIGTFADNLVTSCEYCQFIIERLDVLT
jgi:hypothetical protein